MNILNQPANSEKTLITTPAKLSSVAVNSSPVSSATKQRETVGRDIGSWAQDSIEGLTNFDFSNSFSGLLDQASNVTELNSATQSTINNTIDAQQLAPSTVQSETSLTSMQNGLLSALGLSALGGDESTLLSQIISTPNSSTENLQSSLLSNLQSNLFASFITPEKSNNSAEISDTSTNKITDAIDTDNATLTQSSILTQVAKYSFGDNGLELTDGFDAVNILQHLPVVSTIYQETTGDTLDAAAKLSGGFIYGGSLGLALSAVDLAVEYVSGSSISDTVTNFNYSELLFGTTSNENNTSSMPSTVKSLPTSRANVRPLN